ncbi:MAG: glycosyltransferase family A protein [Hyphomicrobium sp.]|jgi:hypothetical protein
MQYRREKGLSPDCLTANVVALLRRNLRAVNRDGRGVRVHLDVGCGLGDAADVLRDELGLTLVAVSDNDDQVDFLRARGVEAHCVSLEQPELTLSAISRLVGERSVASMSLLNMRGTAYPPALLSSVQRLAGAHDEAICIISAANVAHVENVIRIVLGDDVPGVGGRVPAVAVTFGSLSRQLEDAGLRIVDRNDLQQVDGGVLRRDDNPALNPGTKLYRFVEAIQSRCNPDAKALAFVVACRSGPRRDERDTDREDSAAKIRRPFLSVVTRTQGRRPDELREVLLCLGAQTCRDFEHLIVAHKVSVEERRGIEQAIDELPAWQRVETRIVDVDQGGRSRPLNVGFGEAKGAYISILDDDDIVFGHWVETFKRLAEENFGRVVRTMCVAQRNEKLAVLGKAATSAVGKFDIRFSVEWDEARQLLTNATPNHSLAFPRGCFHDLKLRFDESLNTVEDWDFMMQAANILGVSSVREITAIYRLWDNATSSHTEHDDAEWVRGTDVVRRRLAEQPFLMESGASGGASRFGFDASLLRDARLASLRDLMLLLESTSWRITSALRGPRWLRGEKRIVASDFVAASTSTIRDAIDSVRRSPSWRFTAYLRALVMKRRRLSGRG